MAKKQIDFSEMSVGAQQARSMSNLKGKPMDFSSMTVGAQMEASGAKLNSQAEDEGQPSKKKVDTELSGQTSLLDSSFKAKSPLFDSKTELERMGAVEGTYTPEQRAQKKEEARQQKIAEDKLADYQRSVMYDKIADRADAKGINKGFLAGVVDVGAAITGLAGLLSNFRPSGVSTAEYVNRKLNEQRAGVDPTEPTSLQEERVGKAATTNVAYEAASEMSNLSGFLTKEAKKDIGVSDEDLQKGPVDLMLEGKLGNGLKVLSVEVAKSIPNIIVQAALAPEAGVGFLAQKAATFATTSAMAMGGNVAQDYAQDKDISSEDILKGVAKSAIEGLTESFFMGDINALKGIGSSLAKGETTAAKELLKGVIEKEGKEAAKLEIARGFSKPLAKMLGRGFEGASVVGQFNKGGVEEGIEEVMSSVGSFIVDRVADGNWSDADYKQLLKDASNAFVVGYGSGGMMNGVSAGLSMKSLTDEQKSKVEKFNEVANNESLPAEVRKIARDKADDIIRESADLSYAGYDELTKVPAEKRVEAFTLMSQINAQEESKKDVKDVEMVDAINKSIEAKKGELNYILTGVKPETTEPTKVAEPVTEEEKKTQVQIKTEQEAYAEELAKANESFRVTMGIPNAPMKVSSQFSIKDDPSVLGINQEFVPSPNYPLTISKKENAGKIQFSTKNNPDALLTGDVYSVDQNGKKFATILSTERNGVQEYYVPELDNDKPFSNLDDAKFAVQEKLTGALVPELKRSGIDRLRADKFIPKADIVIKDDNGRETILDPVVKKNIKNAVDAFKTISSAPVYLYKNTEDFKKGLSKEMGKDSEATNAAASIGGGFFTNSRGEDSIHINLANVSETTVAHEIFHGTVVNVARQNPSAFAAMRDAIINKLGDSDLINVRDSKGTLTKLSAKEYLDRYSKQYSPEQQAEEFLSELTGLLATDMAKLKDATIWETIKLAIRNLVKTAGIDIPIFDKTADINDTVKFFNDLSKSIKTGGKIDLTKLKLANEKQGTKQGAPVQATDGKGKIAEEDESLRNSVPEVNVQEQARRGNEVSKKKRKLSDISSRAMAIEPTTPDDYALQYFINGGLVIRGSKSETQEKDTLFSLFSKSRMGGNTEVVSEMRSRLRITGGREAGGLSVSEIAEKTFAEYQQATKGDVGADVSTKYDYMDFKNAVESALLGYKSDSQMANALLASKNKSAETDAIALTEDEEFEKLRIQAEADAMGMTFDEFKSKLAELEGNPTIGAIEDAYVQALDMINDEDMAKLYELSDEDVSKIDALMADLDDNTGALDDKLAEQKKVVRDLEAERKKVVAAIEKAGKETQLDITGKAPIQEQLFGADTKSLTDKLNSIDTQLMAAKADVSATQSAIDFQERGTVDMFEEEASKEEVKPIKEKPVALSKTENEIKSINNDLDYYTRQLEDAIEEIGNTNTNYQQDVDKIKAQKAELASSNLSRAEKAERREELNAEIEDAAEERDTYLEQYNDKIKEAKAEIKKLNKRLAKLQETKPVGQEPSTPAADVTKPIVDETLPESNIERIEDYGEKIGGAKKDLVKKAIDSYDMGIEVDYRNAKYAQLLPTINYNALIKEGTLTQDKAIVIDIIRSKVSTRGSKWYNDAWVNEMISTRQLISNILNDNVDIYDLIENLSIEDPTFDSTFNAMKAIGFPQSGLSLGNYFIKEFGPSNFAVVNGYRIVGSRHNTFDEAAEYLSSLLSGNKSKTKETKFDVYQNRITKVYSIGKKAGRDVVKVMDGFETSDDAFKYIQENRPSLEEVWKEMRQNPDERRGENRTRVGEDYRKGRNVSGEEFGKTFGFRGVEFGNWVNTKERQESVNDAYDALMDLSTALGISPESISLGGKLGLAFGSRGSGKAMAHYERARTVINLTKTKGAGSLAHEWWHALDNYFASPKAANYITEGPADFNIKARQEIKDAFSNILNAINKDTAIKSRSSKLDKSRNDAYWSTPIEMTARSFESFVVSKLAETGNSNDYLANFKELTEWANGGSVSAESYPYPSPDEKDVIGKAYQALFNTIQEKKEGGKTILFQKQGIIAVKPTYEYKMDEAFKDPQRLMKDIEAKYDIRTTLRERGENEAKLIEIEKNITDNAVINALSKVGVKAFKGIEALENAPIFKAGDEDVRAKDILSGWLKGLGNSARKKTLESIQSNNRFAASTGRVAASLIGNLAKSDILQEQRALRTGSQTDANNEIAMLSKGLNGMIGFDEKALMRVHSLLDPEAFRENKSAVTSPSDLSLNELRLYNTLRDINDFMHEWHYQNGFIDTPTYEKHKGKYFARMYEEIERKQFSDLSEAIDKMPSGADFRMFKERKDFSEVELTLMNDPIYITSRRIATMLHNKATIEFCNAMANDPSYVTVYKSEDELPKNNKKGFKKLESNGGGKRYGELTNKYVPLALYEELRGTTFANQFIAKSYDALRMYDSFAIRQFLKKTKTIYNPTTRLGNITSNFAFAWLAGVDPFTMIKNRTRAKDSLDSYDEWAKDLAIAGILGTDIITADMLQKKKEVEKSENAVRQFVSEKYGNFEDQFLDFLNKKGVSKEGIQKAKAKRILVDTKRKELNKYMLDSYGRTDDVAKISLYRSLVEDYGKTREEAVEIVSQSMQNYATVGKAYQFFSKMPVIGNPFVKFSSDLVRIVSNGFANRPLYMASFLGMMWATARLFSELSGEPEDEREAREARAFIPKIPLGFTDIPLTWKVGKYEVNAARFISPYYVYDAGYRSNTIAELTKFAPIQLSYDNNIGWASDYKPTLSDPLLAPAIQIAMDRDFRGMPIADPFGSKYTNETVTESEARWNRINYLGHSYISPLWGYTANLIAAAKGEGDLYGRRRDLGSAILNSVIKVQEMTSEDVQNSVENEMKYIDSEYKQIKTDVTSRRNNDIERIQDIMESNATESQKQKQIDNIKSSYTEFAQEKVDKMSELVEKRDIPYQRWIKLQKLRK